MPKAAEKKLGLVLEGGAMRGLFTAGVLDVMMEAGLDRLIDGAVGVSAGATFGINIKSHQVGRTLRYNLRFCQDWRYGTLKSWIRTGDLYEVDFSYRELPDELDPFDVATYASSPLEFYAVITDMLTGQPVYHPCPKGDAEDIRWVRASASIPGFSRPVMIEGRPYSDGGTADSIPLRFFESAGYSHNVVVLTQPKGYVKEPLRHFGLFKLALRKYPALIEALERRPALYNDETAYVAAQAQAGAAFALYPPEPLGIKQTEHDPRELQRVYDLGRRTTEDQLDALTAFCRAHANPSKAQGTSDQP